MFGNGVQSKVAVGDVSLSLYEGQIMGLLGHNDAGKTVLMNLLTGTRYSVRPVPVV